MTTASLSHADIRIVDAFRGKRVLVVGDVMLDRYLWGRVERISPEAPVPVVEVARESHSLGGAANVAHNVIALGGVPVLLGATGEDAAAARLQSELRQRGIDPAELIPDPERRTTVKTRIIAHQQQVVRADEEDLEPIGAPIRARFERALERLVPDADAIVISDYGKGVVVPELLRPAILHAREHGIAIGVDPKENHFSSYRGATVITPNLHEAGEAFGRRLRDQATLIEAGHAIRERLELRCVLITRGAEGMSLFDEAGSHVHLPTVAREVYDVTGAGDTVIGAFTLAVAAGADFVTAARLANHAAGEVIRHTGTAVVTPETLRASLSAPEGS